MPRDRVVERMVIGTLNVAKEAEDSRTRATQHADIVTGLRKLACDTMRQVPEDELQIASPRPRHLPQLVPIVIIDRQILVGLSVFGEKARQGGTGGLGNVQVDDRPGPDRNGLGGGVLADGRNELGR